MMKHVHRVEFRNASKEELLPGFAPDFPYIASYVEFDKYKDSTVPWHWHQQVELFFVESGVLVYSTPTGKHVFPAGSGGLINTNVLHMTQPRERQRQAEKTIQFVHLLDADFLAGGKGGRIERKYIAPLLSAAQVEIIALHPDSPARSELLRLLLESFRLSEEDFGYELRLRAALSEIWRRILEQCAPLPAEPKKRGKANEKIKAMMIYIHEHYAEKITIADIAAAAFSSERECYRAFRACLHMTPVEYIVDYRLQSACHMLENSQESVTAIGHSCGLGSSSYFGKVFRARFGCTPLAYRQNWQDRDNASARP